MPGYDSMGRPLAPVTQPLSPFERKALQAELDAEQAASGLSRVQFYAQLSQNNDPRLARLNASGGPYDKNLSLDANGHVVDHSLLGRLNSAAPYIVGGIMTAGTLQSAGLLPGGGAAASTTTPLTDLSSAPAFGSTDAGVIAGTSVPAAASAVAPTATAGVLAGLKNLATTPKGIASLVALAPALKNLFGGNDGSNGNNPFSTGSPLMTSAQQSLDMANARTKEAGPIYDALINQAYGQTPTRYRGAAPPTYPAGGDAAPAGAYVFNAPQFGGG